MTPGSEQRRFAQLAARLGDPVFVTPALLASYAAGRLAGLPGLASGSARVTVSVAAAALADLGLRSAIGRARPADSSDDLWDPKPFRRPSAALPSTHTAIAFAAASAVDAETSARWVPWVVYPAAAAVGWSRAVEDRHWTGDVVAGAALGFWAGRRVDGLLRNRVHAFDRATFLMRGSLRNFRVGFATRF